MLSSGASSTLSLSGQPVAGMAAPSARPDGNSLLARADPFSSSTVGSNLSAATMAALANISAISADPANASAGENSGPAEQVPLYMQHMTLVLVVLHASVFLSGLVGNALVCLSVWRNKSLQTVTNYYIVNLALADFLVILVCLPPTVYWDLTLTWNFGLALCKLVPYLQSTSVSVSVLTLTCISLDRWYAICRPLQFSSTKSRAKVMIVVIWFASALIASPDLIYLSTRPMYEENGYVYMDCTYTWPESHTRLYQLCITGLLFVSPYALMCISYWHIVAVLWRNETGAHSAESSMEAGERSRSQLGQTHSSCSLNTSNYARHHQRQTPKKLTTASVATTTGASGQLELLKVSPTSGSSNECSTNAASVPDSQPSCSDGSGAPATQPARSRYRRKRAKPAPVGPGRRQQSKQQQPKQLQERNHHQLLEQPSGRPSKSIRSVQSAGQPSWSQSRFCKLIESRKKAAKMLIVIVIMFGLCYLPVHFLNTLRYTIGLPQNDLTTIASLVSHWLCYFNSAVNPLIYNLMSGKFRHEFANLFRCRCFQG